MKKFRSFLMIAAAGLLAAACTDDVAQVKTLHEISVGEPSFSDENAKVHLTFSTGGFSKLAYDDGDQIVVNGHEYTLHEGNPYWTATANNEDATASTFNCFYGHDAHLASYSDGTMTFNLANTFTNNISSSKGILLAGSTDENVVTLKPACCIIRFVHDGSVSNVKVGFEDQKVPRTGTLSASGQITNATAYFNAVTQAGQGQFLKMVESDGNWYVAVPILGNEIQTTLYFEWVKNGNTASPVKRKTSGRVTLKRGYIYSIGEGAVSPWDENGASFNTFQVGRRTYVAFSAGNLQCQPYKIVNGVRTYNIFKFADKQYSALGNQNEDIYTFYQNYIDLMGWGTSGWVSGAFEYDPSASSTEPEDYWPGDDGHNTDYSHDLTDACANADWGIYNSNNITYGSNSNTGSWRTLTADEWYYLLNTRRYASTKWALGNINGINGLIILPDSWSLPDGSTFNAGSGSGYSTNTYNVDTWDKMEKAGAVFLPAGGNRMGYDPGSVSEIGSVGYYWTTTHTDGEKSKCLIFTNSGCSVSDTKRSRGCNVRLVKEL